MAKLLLSAGASANVKVGQPPTTRIRSPPISRGHSPCVQSRGTHFREHMLTGWLVGMGIYVVWPGQGWVDAPAPCGAQRVGGAVRAAAAPRCLHDHPMEARGQRSRRRRQPRRVDDGSWQQRGLGGREVSKRLGLGDVVSCLPA